MSKIAMQQMAEKIIKMLPKDFGFTITVFPFNNPGVSNYISNANRSDMIKALRETADRLEKRQDFETPQNNMY
jgi:GH25 family lysozyme M1 (1,4-beta-N-acetylmuramidase)